MKAQYRKFNIKADVTGDDYGMMREVLERRFKRLLEENPRAAIAEHATSEEPEDDVESPWPDLVLIDGGQGLLKAASETLTVLGVTDVPLVAIAKGLDRDAGRETFFMAGKSPFKLPPRDPLLYYIERLRDEAFRLPSAPTARAARRTSARPACRKFQASAQPASARCCAISAL